MIPVIAYSNARSPKLNPQRGELGTEPGHLGLHFSRPTLRRKELNPETRGILLRSSKTELKRANTFSMTRFESWTVVGVPPLCFGHHPLNLGDGHGSLVVSHRTGGLERKLGDPRSRPPLLILPGNGSLPVSQRLDFVARRSLNPKERLLSPL